ncbi:MAG: hypothetical protein UZ17_ACD001001993 [Acidobacteria bacterium OLB17]|nr:MAG: hypothetical protein UZ17_ACD001001993 [Acidobacteria bacterium OLB17]MCZ2390129.1 hypothetical protein [Acidobacteriota bacterium]
MKRFALFAVFALLVGAFAQAPAGVEAAKPGRCLLVIDGKTYISGRCDIEMYNDGTGSFQITERRKRGAYFAQVLIDNGEALGYWNEERAATHAHASLGALTRDGACWKNDRARVCAWK